MDQYPQCRVTRNNAIKRKLHQHFTFDPKVVVWKVTHLLEGTCALEFIVLNFKSWQQSRENIGKEQLE